MKLLILILLQAFSVSLFAQVKIFGRYHDYFGTSIQINGDCTFKYSWHFDMSGSWTKGTWKTKGDTIYFHVVPIYDTVSNKNSDGISSDSLILSVDETSVRITPAQYAGRGLYSVQQSIFEYPEKLVYKKDRLYLVKNGRLIKKKHLRLWTKKKFPPWYIKSND